MPVDSGTLVVFQENQQECCQNVMSYTELEYGYQGLRNAARPTQFYVGGVSVAASQYRFCRFCRTPLFSVGN